MNLLQPGEVLILQEDTYSPVTSKGKPKTKYGAKNDEVKIISANHYPVIIVENKKRDRFPVRIEKLKTKPIQKSLYEQTKKI